jgi:GNAT superfamily N-acetyltransferase
MYALRTATPADVPALRALIARSIRALGAADYSSAQIDTALESAFGVDTTLIHDGTYFVAASATGELLACGGWSRRRTLFGSDERAERDASWLDPATEAAKIRAFFVDPAYARQGLARAILERSEGEATNAGFSAFALMATLPGVAFYERCGYRAEPAIVHTLPGGLPIRFVPMAKQLEP